MLHRSVETTEGLLVAGSNPTPSSRKGATAESVPHGISSGELESFSMLFSSGSEWGLAEPIVAAQVDRRRDGRYLESPVAAGQYDSGRELRALIDAMSSFGGSENSVPFGAQNTGSEASWMHPAWHHADHRRVGYARSLEL
ncbi:hypothetical protein ACFQGW_04430 [Xanthomonas theicola]|uniref:hypothetical protein n=1 Tax=Xanthomonas theicola TaxID=56464 RepID=UPI000FF8A529|nr:hypothetical protein [Xanthomonas theicola]QNH24202.1 hypothetical protein G4Q83_04785 [Xanthomonas theicola]